MGSRLARIGSVLAVIAAACQADGDPPLNLTPLPERLPEDAGAVKPDAAPSDAGTTAVVDAAADADAALKGVVFASSTASGGAMGSLAGADARCVLLAADAGLTGPFTAWLSGNPAGPHAIDRVTGTGPWRLVTGELVALDKTELASGTLRHAIDRDEKGAALVGTTAVWTGTGPNGRYLTNDCDIWRPGGNEGRFGDATKATSEWTSAGVGSCGGARRIYCFGN